MKKIIFIKLPILGTLILCFIAISYPISRLSAQVQNITEGEIQSTSLSGIGDRNVVADPSGVLKIDESITTYNYSADRLKAFCAIPGIINENVEIYQEYFDGWITSINTTSNAVSNTDEIWVVLPLDVKKSILESVVICFQTVDSDDGSPVLFDHIQVVTVTDMGSIPFESNYLDQSVILQNATGIACNGFTINSISEIQGTVYLKLRVVMGATDKIGISSVQLNTY